ncbi:MAG: hypothetical protein AAF657_06375 [Acidobacteriota bacterium]
MARREFEYFVLVALATSLIGLAPAEAAEPDSHLAGVWTGAMINQPAVNEIDLTIEITRQDDTWQRELRVPLAGLRVTLDHWQVEGSQVDFGFEDANGRRTFSGELAPDRKSLRGTYTRGEQTSPFELTKKPQNAPPRIPEFPDLQKVPGDGSELAKIFDQDKDRMRLLMMLSPTCITCQISARVVERHVLDHIDDERLRVYVYWMPVFETDHDHDAESAMWTVSDPRARHFWAEGLDLANAYATPLGLSEGPAWDVFLAFPQGAAWKDPVPLPSYFQHHAKELSDENRFNGTVLADELRKLLASSDEGR